MEVQTALQKNLRLNDWLVKPDLNEISRQDEIKKLDHKVMQLLVFFAENSGRDLSKDEILRAVWGEGVFTDDVLTVAVSSLRKALGDDPRSPKYIKTIPRYGYRMLMQTSGIKQSAKIRGLLEFLDQRIGLRFLIVAIIFVLFLLIMLTKSHLHF